MGDCDVMRFVLISHLLSLLHLQSCVPHHTHSDATPSPTVCWEQHPTALQLFSGLLSAVHVCAVRSNLYVRFGSGAE